jgi:hypothetical protein
MHISIVMNFMSLRETYSYKNHEILMEELTKSVRMLPNTSRKIESGH